MGSLRSTGRLGLLALVWGSSFLWIKLSLGGFAPLQITFVRLVLGAAVLYGFLRLRRERLPRDLGLWVRLLVPAVIGSAIPFTLFAFAERTVDSGVAGVLNSTTPLWALLFGLLLGTERWSNTTKLLGLLLGFGGVLVIFEPWNAHGLAGWGTAACLVAAASYATSYTYISRTLSHRVSPLTITTAQLGMAAVFTAIALPVGGEMTVHLSLPATVAVVILGVLGTGFAMGLNNKIIKEEGATAAASIGYLLPVVSVLLGAVFLREPLSWRTVAGMVIVLAGVMLSRVRSRRAPSVPTAPAPVPAAAHAEEIVAEQRKSPLPADA
jgi:drug/metabolite transporter (DMT)-like permease